MFEDLDSYDQNSNYVLLKGSLYIRADGFCCLSGKLILQPLISILRDGFSLSFLFQLPIIMVVAFSMCIICLLMAGKSALISRSSFRMLTFPVQHLQFAPAQYVVCPC